MTTCRVPRATATKTVIHISDEETWGTDASHTPYGLEFVRETLRQQIQSVDQQHRITKGRAADVGYLTNKDANGEIRGELQPHGPWPLIFKHALGSVSTAGSFPHVHTMDGADTLPTGMTITKYFEMTPGVYKRRSFLGAKVNRLFLHVRKRGFVTARTVFMAREEVNSEVASVPLATWLPNNRPLTVFDTSIRLAVATDDSPPLTTICSNLDLVLQNNLRDDYSPASGRKRHKIIPGPRTVGGSVTAFFTSGASQEWLDAWEANTTMQLIVTFARSPYSIQVHLPAIKLRGTTPQVADRGPVNLRIPFTAGKDSSIGTDIRMTVTNADPSIQTAA